MGPCRSVPESSCTIRLLLRDPAPLPQEFVFLGCFIMVLLAAGQQLPRLDPVPLRCISTVRVAHRAGEICSHSSETGWVQGGKQMLSVVGGFPHICAWWGAGSSPEEGGSACMAVASSPVWLHGMSGLQ